MISAPIASRTPLCGEFHLYQELLITVHRAEELAGLREELHVEAAGAQELAHRSDHHSSEGGHEALGLKLGKFEYGQDVFSHGSRVTRKACHYKRNLAGVWLGQGPLMISTPSTQEPPCQGPLMINGPSEGSSAPFRGRSVEATR